MPAPGRVANVRVTPEIGQLQVQWNAVTEADGYVVQWKSGAQAFSDTERRHVIDSGATTSYTIPNLVSGRPYTVRVTATRQFADDGPPSAEVAGTPSAPAPAPLAAATVPTDWPLIPEDSEGNDLFTSGQSFRLLFVTSTTRNGQDGGIGAYNSFVQGRARAGHTDIRTFGGRFRALASTGSTDARDNTATTGAGEPIYWLGGARVANNNADFYDGSWDSQAARNESGSSVASGQRVWTGSNNDGTEYFPIPGLQLNSRALGSAFPRYGQTGSGSPLSADDGLSVQSHRLYGLSPVLTVQMLSPGLTLSDLSVSPVVEGGSASYTVRLDSPPGEDVIVTITSDRADVTVDTDGDMAGDQNTLTFSATNWSVLQTVTVNVAQDADALDGSATLTHAITGASAYDTLADPTLAVDIEDDDTAGVTLSALSASPVTEAGTATYTVRLDTRPSATVTVTITSDNDDVTVDTDGVETGGQDRLTFTTADWSTPKTVTVHAGADDDAVDDSATLTHAITGAGEYQRLADPTLTVDVDDDDAAAVAISAPAPLPVTEGNTAAYTVKLASRPSANVTVTITSDNAEVTVDTDADAAGNQNALTFTPDDWNRPQAVTVSAAEDTDAADDSATLTHAIRGAAEYDALADPTATIAVNDNDDDMAGVTVSALSPSILTEGGTGSYSVVLDNEPTGDVRVTVTSDNVDVTVDTDGESDGDQNVLLFTADDWNAPRTVTVDAAEDTDAADDSATLTHTAAGGGYDSLSASLAVMVTDTTPALSAASVNGAALVLTYNEALDTSSVPAAGAFTVEVNDGEVDLADANPVAISGSTVTLTLASAVTHGQTVTVSYTAPATNPIQDAAGHDAGNLSDQAVTNRTPRPPSVTIAADAATVTEGSAAAFTVTASAAPAAALDVKVSVTAAADFGVSAGDHTVTLSAGATTGSLSIPTTGDALDEANAAITATVQAGTGYTVGTASSAQVTIQDDDTAPGAPGNLQAAAGDRSATLTWDAPGETGTSDTISFWRVQYATDAAFTMNTVNVSVIGEDVAARTRVVLGLTNGTQYWFRVQAATEAGFGAWSAAATTTPADTTAPALSTSTPPAVSGTTLTLTYDEALDTGSVPGPGAFAVTVNGTGVNLANASPVAVAGSAVTLTLASAVVAGDTVTVSYTAPTGTGAKPIRDASANHNVAANLSNQAVSNVTPGIVLSASELTVNEGSSATYTVRLNTQPGGNVTVTVARAPGGSDDVAFDTNDGTTGDQATLTFTGGASGNWATAQTVTVRAAPDTDTATDTATLTHTVTAGGYASHVANLAVTVSEAGDVTAPSLSTASVNGASLVLTYDENLDESSVPGSGAFAVTVKGTGVSLADTNPVVIAGSAVTLTLASAVAAGDVVTVSYTAPTGQDAKPIRDASANHNNAANLSDQAVTNVTPGVVLSVSSLALTEGAAAKSYTVQLTAAPSENVIVTITSDNAEVTVDTDDGTDGDQNQLTFTTMNWSTAQSVAVTAGQDDDSAADTATLTHALTGADEYDNLDDPTLSVEVADDDTPGPAFSVTELTVTEGAAASYTVKLATKPSGDVTVTIRTVGDLAVDTNAGMDGDQNTLSFTTGNWSTAQTVAVRGLDDDDSANDSAGLEHAFTGAAEYAALEDVTLEATVTDDDTPALVFAPTSVTVNEGYSTTYTVKLATQPNRGGVFVTLSSSNSEVTVRPSRLTFVTSTWSMAQTVRVTAAWDTDSADDSATLTHAIGDASATEYAALTDPTLPVTVNDDGATAATNAAPPAPGVQDRSATVGSAFSYEFAAVTDPDGDEVTYSAVLADGTALSTVWLTFDEATRTFGGTPAVGDAGALRVRVTATDDGTPVRSASRDFTVTVGEYVPRTFRADQGSRRIRYTWAAPSGGAVGGYELRYGTDASFPDASTTTVTILANETVRQVRPLTNDVIYYAQIRAKDSTGDFGPWSYTLAATPGNGYQAPSVPAAPTVSAGVGQLDVTWTAPNDRGSTIVEYDVRHIRMTAPNQHVDANWTVASGAWRIGEDTALSHTISGLTNGVSYNVAVRATNAVGDSWWSSSTAGTPVATGVVLSPTSLTVFEGGSGTYTVELSAAPSGDVTVEITSDNADVTIDDTDGGTSGVQNTLTFTTSNWDTAQTVTVQAADDADAAADTATLTHTIGGASEYDNLADPTLGVTVTENDKLPGAPTIDSVTGGATRLTVAWSAPSDPGYSNGTDASHTDNAVTAYDVRHILTSATDKSDSHWTVVDNAWTSGGGDLEYAIASLTDGQSYDVQVRAVTQTGDGPWSATSTGTPQTDTTAPTLSTATVNGASLTLTWNEPLDTNSVPATSAVHGDRHGPVGVERGGVRQRGDAHRVPGGGGGRGGDGELHGAGEQPGPGHGGERCGESFEPGGGQRDAGGRAVDLFADGGRGG